MTALIGSSFIFRVFPLSIVWPSQAIDLRTVCVCVAADTLSLNARLFKSSATSVSQPAWPEPTGSMLTQVYAKYMMTPRFFAILLVMGMEIVTSSEENALTIPLISSEMMKPEQLHEALFPAWQE
eukprot:1386783-Amphidinium_carterae.1